MLTLFLTFLKIGTVSFGGGYGMISLIREECLSNGWLTEEQILNFIAVSESTPGPIAINMATFIGSLQGGLLGAMLATLGVVLPSFIIILIISSLIKNLLKIPVVKNVLASVKPAIVGMITATAFTMFLSLIFGLKAIENTVVVDYKSLILFAFLSVVILLYKKLRKKNFSPILLILISGVLGIIIF